jgi:hypothetical protein
VVDLIVSMKRLTKVLMDGGNGLNIMYAEMLDAIGIDRVTPQVLGLHLTLALHEPKHHLFTYEHGTYPTHL